MNTYRVMLHGKPDLVIDAASYRIRDRYRVYEFFVRDPRHEVIATIPMHHVVSIQKILKNLPTSFWSTSGNTTYYYLPPITWKDSS